MNITQHKHCLPQINGIVLSFLFLVSILTQLDKNVGGNERGIDDFMWQNGSHLVDIYFTPKMMNHRPKSSPFRFVSFLVFFSLTAEKPHSHFGFFVVTLPFGHFRFFFHLFRRAI